MTMDLPAAYSRINRANGGTEGHHVRIPSDSTSGSMLKDRRSTSGSSQLRSFWPMLLVLALAAVVLLTTGSQLHHSTTAQPEVLSQTIQQLSQDQAAMMQMLQKLSTNSSSAAAAAAAAPEQEQQAGAGADAAAAAAAGEEPLPRAFAAIPKLTTLHNELLRSSHTYEQHRTVMRDTLQQLVHLEPDAALADIQKQLKDPANSNQHMALFTYRLYKLLLSTEKLIPCREDTTLVANDPELAAGLGHSSSTSSHHLAHLPHLPHWGHHSSSAAGAAGGSSSTAAAGTAPTTRYYFATNLRDNSVNMPQYILSLLQTLLRLPQGAVFVSAYESNSDDGAHGWVDVLQLALNVIGTPSRLVTRGMLVRLEGSNRIQHLARVRNMALAPLYQHYAAARDRTLVANSSSVSGSSAVSSSSSGSSGRRRLSTTAQLEAVAAVDDAANLPPGVLPWDPDYVVFVNDAYFCWGQVIRLLNYKADITCGMDFWQNADATVELPMDLARKHHKPKPHIPSEYRLERPIRKPESPDQDNPIVFYDVWVARDLSGSKFWWNYPYVHDQGTQHAAQKGLPFRASCCWNGLAVLKAAPFKEGVRIRPPMKDECQGSECTMLCNDFARLGYDFVVVDAGVQLTYDWNLAREMMALGIEGYGQSTWAQAKAAGIAERNRKPDYKNIECCGLKSRFTQWVNFNTDCDMEDIMAVNFTARALAGS